MLNYPTNPTGCSYSPVQLKGLAQIARRYHAVLLSEKIYEDLDFGGLRALTAAMQQASGGDPEEEFVASYCASVLEAIDRLVDWLP